MKYEATALEQAVFVSMKTQMDVLGTEGIDSTALTKATVSQRPEYERQIDALEESKLQLYEQYQLREIDLDTFKAENETLNAQLLKIKNAYAALTTRTKREQAEKEKEAQRRSITKELTEATCLTTVLAKLLSERVRLYPGGRIEIEYKVQDLFH
jgi:hypothetical protein